MGVRLAIVTLVALAAFTQQARRTAVVGTIASISGDQIVVKAGTESVMFQSDRDTRVWKGKTPGELSALRTGDEVSVHSISNASGTRLARDVWAQTVSFPAVITKMDPANSEILTRLKTGVGSAKPSEYKIVRHFANTVFSTSRIRLEVGQEILVVGFDLRDGSVDAFRIATYNTDLPLNRLMPAPRRR